MATRNGVLRGLALLTLPLFLASTSSAYYYYVHYNGRSGPFLPIIEKFDLTALNNNTVPFFISDQGPATLAAGDSFQAIVSEIRSAAQVWNNVQTSNLRLSYGGLYTIGATESAPEIHIMFSDEIPPGLLALSGPESRGSLTVPSTGERFVPITRSKMLLKNDLSQLPGPSHSELFFTTLVHEFGHTLGLQHTLTSSVMSTAITSTSTKAAPLGPDDIAGVSMLYPASGYSSTVGSITGRVISNNGNGVNLASVVAISTSNAPISALTNPDGTFEIDGLPPQQYYLYVHPLPPPQLGESYAANITPPTDLDKGKPFLAGPNFVTQFYPGTSDFNQAQFVFVSAGNQTQNVNFKVTQKNDPPISSVRIYGYSSAGIALTSPQVFVGVPAPLVASGTTGLLQNSLLTPGLNVGMLGTSAVLYNLQPYYQDYVLFDVYATNTAGPGPKHLFFSTPDDIYVLPCAFAVVLNPPPAITSLSSAFDNQGNRIVFVQGTNLQSDARIFFDGLPATIKGTTSDGRLIVLPPPAPGSHTATVVALNSSDAQSSLFLQSPPTFTYDPSNTPVVTASPQFLTPGEDTVVDIVAQNIHFVDGQVAVGFGTSDVQVKQVKVLSPTHLRVIAAAPTGEFVPTAALNITNGIALISQSLGFSILPPAPAASSSSSQLP